MRPGPSGEDTRNMILAIVLSVAVLFGYQWLIVNPQREAAQREAAFHAQQEQTQPAEPAAPIAETPAAASLATREQALAVAEARVPFAGHGVRGSVNLLGARLDDLSLQNYRKRLPADSPAVELLSPLAGPYGADAVFGWQEDARREPLVNDVTPWRTLSEGPLTPENPLLLQADLPDGLRLTRRIELSDEFLFTLTDRLENPGTQARSVRPFAYVRRKNLPEDYRVNGVVHQGLIGVVAADDKALLRAVKYEKARDAAKKAARSSNPQLRNQPLLEAVSVGGWLGLTDHYWLNAVLPDQGEALEVKYRAIPEGADNYFLARYDGAFRDLPAGGAVEYTQRFYSGAKRAEVLKRYETELGVPDFDKAIDWGNFWFLTRPLFAMLHWFFTVLGNYGLAIMAATVVIKVILFPLVNHSYKAMAKMRALAPKQKEIQERFAADKQRQQQEIIALFQREKVNPMAGCLPMLLPVPVFFALYKVLTVTIELRHEPFFGWIQDLSAPDPTSWINLFGLLPFSAPTGLPLIGIVFAVGAWPILYGLAQWATMSLNPPPPDPVQASVFKWLPALFTVMFATFPAGLVIYWTWSNALTFVQQYIVMRMNGVETELDKFLAKRFGRAPA